jgi:hypothetical protein
MAIQANPQVKNGALITGQGVNTLFNITAPTVVKTTSGRICRVSVIVAGTAVGSVNDVATTAGVAVTNQLAVIPDVVGSYDIDMPCAVGLVVTPGTGQTLAISYI